MLLHPEVQSRALAEVNAVCGDNLPSFEHRPSLPYIEAICREVLRWHRYLEAYAEGRGATYDISG
jgi:cytochrome P450